MRSAAQPRYAAGKVIHHDVVALGVVGMPTGSLVGSVEDAVHDDFNASHLPWRIDVEGPRSAVTSRVGMGGSWFVDCSVGRMIGRRGVRDIRETPGDFIAVLSAGAYAMSMASNYNTRPRAAEVMVSGREASLIRERESLVDLLRGERLLDAAEPTPT